MYKINSSSQKILEKMLGKKYREIYQKQIADIYKQYQQKVKPYVVQDAKAVLVGEIIRSIFGLFWEKLDVITDVEEEE